MCIKKKNLKLIAVCLITFMLSISIDFYSIISVNAEANPLDSLTFNEPAYSIGTSSIYKLQSGIVSVTAGIKNSGATPVNITLIVALYENNNFVNVSFDQRDAVANATTPFNTTITVPSSGDINNYKIKVFAWDSIANMRPVIGQYQLTTNSIQKQIADFRFNTLTPVQVGGIDEANKQIIVYVPESTDVTNLTPAITLPTAATVSPASGVAQNFSTPVNYTVTAEDGTSAVYKVIVYKTTSVYSEDFLGKSTGSITGWTIAPTSNTASSAITVESDAYQSDYMKLNRLASVDATIKAYTPFTAANDADIVVDYKVKYEGANIDLAEVGLYNSDSESSNPDIRFSTTVGKFASRTSAGPWDSDSNSLVTKSKWHDIKIVLQPKSATNSSAMAKYYVDGKLTTISAVNNTNVDGLKGIRLWLSSSLVGSPSAYRLQSMSIDDIRVSKASVDTKITSFSFAGLSPVVTGTIDNVTKQIIAYVPTGTSVTSLTPTIAVSLGSTVSPASGVARDFTSPVTYTVTGGDGTTTTYTVKVYRMVYSEDFTGKSTGSITDWTIAPTANTASSAITVESDAYQSDYIKLNRLASADATIKAFKSFTAANNAEIVVEYKVKYEGANIDYAEVGLHSNGDSTNSDIRFTSSGTKFASRTSAATWDLGASYPITKGKWYPIKIVLQPKSATNLTATAKYYVDGNLTTIIAVNNTNAASLNAIRLGLSNSQTGTPLAYRLQSMSIDDIRIAQTN